MTDACRWEADDRYYAARLEQDLLDDWILQLANGGKRNNLGQLRTIWIPDEKTDKQYLAQLNKQRLNHDYKLTSANKTGSLFI